MRFKLVESVSLIKLEAWMKLIFPGTQPYNNINSNFLLDTYTFHKMQKNCRFFQHSE